MANLTGHSQTLRAGTVLGKLYSVRSIPVEVEHIKTLEEVMELMTDLSVNTPIHPPSMFTGPIYQPNVAELKQALNYSHGRSEVVGVNTVSSIHGPGEMEFFDINPELEATQKKEALRKILIKHSKIFSTSLSQVGQLKTKPYEIQVQKDAVSVKVAPRMIPRAAQEWFKSYLDQLLELKLLIEPCTGPWAADVVLVPFDADKRTPRRRKVQAMKSSPKLLF